MCSNNSPLTPVAPMRQSRLLAVHSMQGTRHGACLTLGWAFSMTHSKTQGATGSVVYQAGHQYAHTCRLPLLPAAGDCSAPDGPRTRLRKMLQQGITQCLVAPCKGVYPASAGHQPVHGGQVQGPGAGPAAGRARACSESVADRAHPRHVHHPSPGAPAAPLPRQPPAMAPVPCEVDFDVA